MPNSILYFPYINLPKTDWTIRTLLYYDSVSSIVPIDYFYDPEGNYEPFMLELVKRELVVPLDPLGILDHPLTQPFLNFVQSKGYRIDAKRRGFQLGGSSIINRQKFDQPARINSLKFDEGLLSGLSELGIARRKEGNWFEVEKTTANYLMTYLASILGAKLELTPTTDKLINLDFLGESKRTNSLAASKRRRILRDLIPYPNEINLDKLQNFKQKNLNALNRFRNVIEQVALDPKYENEKLFVEKITELKLQKEEISRQMSKSNLGGIFFGTACGIFGAFQGLAQLETVGAIVGGLPGFTSAVYSALKIEKPEGIFDQTGMKYLALVEKRIMT